MFHFIALSPRASTFLKWLSQIGFAFWLSISILRCSRPLALHLVFRYTPPAVARCTYLFRTHDEAGESSSSSRLTP
jgi:hypothetical protein